MAVAIVAVVIVLLAIVVTFKSVALVPQAEAAVIERLGRYSRTVSGQLTFLVPFADRVRAKVDLRERVVSFPPQPVITQDNLTVQIDSVVYFQVTSPQAAVYEISNYIAAVEQLTITTLRNVVGGMTLEETLTSRDQINSQLRGVLDEATGRWGLRVSRVELKAIDPPPSIQESMEKQMKADREKRAMILTAEGQREASIKTAEGQKQAQILAAEGSKQASILSAEGERQSRILRAQGERAAAYLQAQGQAKAIEKVFAAIKNGKPTPSCWPTSTCRPCPRWPRATPTRCGWCPAMSARPSRASPAASPSRARTAYSATNRPRTAVRPKRRTTIPTRSPTGSTPPPTRPPSARCAPRRPMLGPRSSRWVSRPPRGRTWNSTRSNRPRSRSTARNRRTSAGRTRPRPAPGTLTAS